MIKKNSLAHSYDVVIVGGGISGLSVADRLSDSGLSIGLFEKDTCGSGITGTSSGFITPDSELEFTDLIKRFGKEDAIRLRQHVLTGVRDIQENIKRYSLSCDYTEQDCLIVANSKKAFKGLREEYDDLTKNGFEAKLWDQGELARILKGRGYFGGMSYGGTFGIDGELYIRGLKGILEERGVSFFEKTPVISVREGQIEIRDDRGRDLSIAAKHIIICADRCMEALGIYPEHIYGAKTFLSVSAPLSKQGARNIFPAENYMTWDTDLIYQYFRLTGDNRLLFGASSLLLTYSQGESRRGSRSIERKIKRYEEERFSSSIPFEEMRMGLIGISKDFLPLAGEHGSIRGLYYVSCVSGIPWGAASGRYIAEKILQGRKDMDGFFRADRKYPLPRFLEKMLPKKIIFMISHAILTFL
jgi:gamma-glutamylputrescine oxidase